MIPPPAEPPSPAGGESRARGRAKPGEGGERNSPVANLVLGASEPAQTLSGDSAFGLYLFPTRQGSREHPAT